MKALAAVFSGKSARMMAPADAERLTGYRVGGISPFGQKRTAPTVVETAALAEATVFVNGGQRGLQIEAAPTDLARAMSATIASIVAGD
jgi:Cys-tRNA(Pro)/Cys-tRNA(Cys) deacylase